MSLLLWSRYQQARPPHPAPFVVPVRKKHACLRAISIACLNAIPFLILCSPNTLSNRMWTKPFHMWHRLWSTTLVPIPWHNSINPRKTSWLWISTHNVFGHKFLSHRRTNAHLDLPLPWKRKATTALAAATRGATPLGKCFCLLRVPPLKHGPAM